MDKGRLEIFHNYFSTDHAWINKSWGTFFSLKRRSSVWWKKNTKVNEMLEEGRKWSTSSSPHRWALQMFPLTHGCRNVCSIQEDTVKSNVIRSSSLSFVEGLFCCLGLWLFLKCWAWISAAETCPALSSVVLAYIVRPLIRLINICI